MLTKVMLLKLHPAIVLVGTVAAMSIDINSVL
jgi:hypothetical protein